MLLRLLVPTGCVQCDSGAIERFDVLRMPFEDGGERGQGFCMLLSREHDLREADLAVDIAGDDRKRLAKRGICSVEVAITDERAPEIDLGLRCGWLTFRNPPIDVCCVKRVPTALGGMRQPHEGRGIEIGARGRRIR